MSEHTVHLNAPPETLDDDPTLSGLMTHRLLGITPDAELHVALRLLAASGVRHLPVLEGNRCIGLLTEVDVLRALTRPRPLLGPSPVVVQLCRSVPVLRPGDRRTVAAAAMHDSGIDAVLVVEHDLLVGIVTATDLVRSLAPRPGTEGTSDPAGMTLPHGIVVR